MQKNQKIRDSQTRDNVTGQRKAKVFWEKTIKKRNGAKLVLLVLASQQRCE